MFSKDLKKIQKLRLLQAVEKYFSYSKPIFIKKAYFRSFSMILSYFIKANFLLNMSCLLAEYVNLKFSNVGNETFSTIHMSRNANSLDESN